MKKVRLWLLVFLCMMAVFQVLLTEELLESAHRRNCFSYETAFRNLRNHNLTKDQVNTFFNNAGSDMEGFCELLTMYFASDCQMTDPKLLKKQVADAKKYRGNEFTEINGYVKSVWCDLLCFPVGKIAGKPEDNVVFENSWMQSRTFGGDRGHEGTDIMASENVRGIYPVYSMTDGVVENIGWLRALNRGISMYEELCKCQELFTKFGGHPIAADFPAGSKCRDFQEEKWMQVCGLTEEDFIPKIKIDIPMPVDYPDIPLVNGL